MYTVRHYIRFLEHAATQGLAGTAEAEAATVHAEAGLYDTWLMLDCVLRIGLRSLSHARLCLQLTTEFMRADHHHSDTLAVLQCERVMKKLNFALTTPEKYQWLLGPSTLLLPRPDPSVLASFREVYSLERATVARGALKRGCPPRRRRAVCTRRGRCDAATLLLLPLPTCHRTQQILVIKNRRNRPN